MVVLQIFKTNRQAAIEVLKFFYKHMNKNTFILRQPLLLLIILHHSLVPPTWTFVATFALPKHSSPISKFYFQRIHIILFWPFLMSPILTLCQGFTVLVFINVFEVVFYNIFCLFQRNLNKAFYFHLYLA
jgi:hypothetical protein